MEEKLTALEELFLQEDMKSRNDLKSPKEFTIGFLGSKTINS